MHMKNNNWLVVLTILNNISQWKGLFPIYGKNKAMFQTTNQITMILYPFTFLTVYRILKAIQVDFSLCEIVNAINLFFGG